MPMPLLAVTSGPSADTSAHSNNRRSLTRFAERSGSSAAENAIIENCGTRRYAIVVVIWSIRYAIRFLAAPHVAVDHRDVVFARACTATSRDFVSINIDFE